MASWLRATVRLIGLASGVALLTSVLGCGGALAGQWHMIQTIPNKDMFNIDDAHFREDGSFTATTTIDGKTLREVGTYEFNGFKLTMRPQAGGQRIYTTTLKVTQLEISDGKRRVILQKGPRQGKS
jgi:hypothetical protein